MIDLSTTELVQAALHKAVDGMKEHLDFCLSVQCLPLIKLTVTDQNGERVKIVVGIEPAEDDEGEA